MTGGSPTETKLTHRFTATLRKTAFRRVLVFSLMLACAFFLGQQDVSGQDKVKEKTEQKQEQAKKSPPKKAADDRQKKRNRKAAGDSQRKKRKGNRRQTKSPGQEKAKAAKNSKQQQRRQRDNSPTIYWPKDVAFDKAIPTPKQFFGFEVGHRHLRHDQVAAYMRELARVSDRITISQYAMTHGGRPNLLLTITSPENHSNLDQIRRQHRRISKPNLQDSAQVEFQNIPVVMNMGYGVHGDEPSATNTSPLVAHYLAAAQGPEVDKTLKNCVILLDPSLNPDGFDRFARWANTFRGRVPNPDSAHIEHTQGWPAGRVNYYWFDLNRDWLPVQHPESQGRMRWYHSWKPNVVLDFHEMGTNSTFFFQPGIPERKNPLTPLANVQLTREMATYHAKDLDDRGSLYFTQELFDDFYMGKGSTYPDLHGAVGILFEQGSSRGHIQETANGIIRFSDTIRNQFTASLSSLRGATEMREKLLSYQSDFYRKSLKDAASSKIKTYVFSSPNNRTRLQKFADILLRHDIQCFWLQKETNIDGQMISAGSLIVPAEQPEYRFLRSLVERRKTFKESVFYDVSAWTLPLAFNLKQRGLNTTLDSTGDLRACKIGEKPSFDRDPDALLAAEANEKTVAWFMDWRDDAAPRVLQQLLAADVHVRVAMRPLTVESGFRDASFGYGTISIPMKLAHNQPKRRAINRIVSSAMKNGVPFRKVTSGLANGGIDLGSNNFPRVQPRKVAMLVGSGVSAYDAGAAWHQLDHRVQMPVTMIPLNRAASTDFSNYTTVVVVGGRYNDEKLVDRLKRFVSGGGSLIGISSGAQFAQRSIVGVSEEVNEKQAKPTDSAEQEKEEEEELPQYSEARKLAALRLVSGAIFATKIDPTHPLMFGFDSKRLPVFRRSTSLLSAAKPEVSNPAVYLKEPLLAGYASKENQEKIAGTSAVAVHSMGRGRVILIADNPNFRAFWPATSRVFLNAVFFGDKVR